MSADPPHGAWRARAVELLCRRGGGLALVVLLAGWWLAPREYVDGDNAEMSGLGALGGVAHPPGFPAYVVWLRAMSWLPGDTAAQVAARATVVLAALAAFALHRACRAWGASSWSSSISVAVVAGSPIVLRLGTAAEVFELNVLVAAIVVVLSAGGSPVRGAWRTWLLALVAGLGLANHTTCVLLAPVGLRGAWLGVRESERPAPVVIAGAVAALGLGLSVYTYAYLAPTSPVSWGTVGSLAELYALFTRQDYSGPWAFSPRSGSIDVIANLSAFAMALGRAWAWFLAVCGVVGLFVRVVRRGAGEPRAGWVAFALSFLLAGPLLVARFDIPPRDLGLLICHRFYMLPIALLAIPVACTMDWLSRAVAPRVRERWAASGGLQVTLVAMVFGASVATSLPYLLATHSPAVQRGVENLLRSLPPDAVVLATSDDLYFGAGYSQRVARVRPDVDVVSWTMTSLPWCRARLAARGLPLDPFASGNDPPSVRVARQVFATGRPLFVEFTMGTLLERLPSYPHGGLFRILPPEQATPTLDDLYELNRQLFAAFDLAYPRVEVPAYYAFATHLRYVRAWDIIARGARDAGRLDVARAALAIRDQLDLHP